MNNCMPIKWATWRKWTNSYKSSLPRLSQEEIEHMNRSITITEIETVIKKKKTPNKQKSRMWWIHRQILSNIKRRVKTYSSETVPENHRWRKTSKFILWGHHHPDTQISRDTIKKRKEMYRPISLINIDFF